MFWCKKVEKKNTKKYFFTQIFFCDATMSLIMCFNNDKAVNCDFILRDWISSMYFILYITSLSNIFYKCILYFRRKCFELFIYFQLWQIIFLRQLTSLLGEFFLWICFYTVLLYYFKMLKFIPFYMHFMNFF